MVDQRSYACKGVVQVFSHPIWRSQVHTPHHILHLHFHTFSNSLYYRYFFKFISLANGLYLIFRLNFNIMSLSFLSSLPPQSSHFRLYNTGHSDILSFIKLKFDEKSNNYLTCFYWQWNKYFFSWRTNLLRQKNDLKWILVMKTQ